MPQGAELLGPFSGLGSKHRNACVSDGDLPNILGLLKTVVDECSIWCMVGASNLQDRSLGHLPHNF